MAKPLNLQIFEKHPDVDAYRFGPSFTPYAIVAQEKRFTDAEIATEYWRGEADLATEAVGDYTEEDRGESCTWSLSGWDVFLRLEILHRFATLPHYDEEKQ